MSDRSPSVLPVAAGPRSSAIVPALVKLAALAALGVLPGVLASCGGEDVAFGVTSAWSRPTPTGAADGVLYFSLGSDRDDALVAVDVPETVAGSAELHRTEGGSGGGGHSHGGGGEEVMSMEQVQAVPVGAGERVEFAPGGNHVMLVDLVQPLARGASFEVTMRFESGRSLVVPVVVGDNPPG